MPPLPENNAAPNSSGIKSKATLLGQVAVVSPPARQMLRPGRLTQVLSRQLVSLVRHRRTAMGPPHYSPWAAVAASGGASRVRARARVDETSILPGAGLNRCACVAKSRLRKFFALWYEWLVRDGCKVLIRLEKSGFRCKKYGGL